VNYAKTTAKQLVGVHVEFAYLLSHFLPDAGSLFDLPTKLAETPCSRLYKTTISPARNTIALFKGPELRVVH
jgi:hypothetical protein